MSGAFFRAGVSGRGSFPVSGVRGVVQWRGRGGDDS